MILKDFFWTRILPFRLLQLGVEIRTLTNPNYFYFLRSNLYRGTAESFPMTLTFKEFYV